MDRKQAEQTVESTAPSQEASRRAQVASCRQWPSSLRFFLLPSKKLPSWNYPGGAAMKKPTPLSIPFFQYSIEVEIVVMTSSLIWCLLKTSRHFSIQRKKNWPFSDFFDSHLLAPLLLNLLPLGHLFPWLLALHITVGRYTHFSCLRHKRALLSNVMGFAYTVPLERPWEGGLTSEWRNLVGLLCSISCPQPLDIGHGPGFFSLDTRETLNPADSKASRTHLLVSSWTKVFFSTKTSLSRATEGVPIR